MRKDDKDKFSCFHIGEKMFLLIWLFAQRRREKSPGGQQRLQFMASTTTEEQEEEAVYRVTLILKLPFIAELLRNANNIF